MCVCIGDWVLFTGTVAYIFLMSILFLFALWPQTDWPVTPDEILQRQMWSGWVSSHDWNRRICGEYGDHTRRVFRYTVEMVSQSKGLMVYSLSGASWRPRPLLQWRCERLFPEWSAPASNLKALQALSQASQGSHTGPHSHVQTHKNWLPNTINRESSPGVSKKYGHT